MPSYFSNLTHPSITVNNFSLTQNCYYCSVAALLGTTVSDLIKKTETMQQDAANVDETLKLFNDAGTPATAVQCRSQNDLDAACNAIPRGCALGIAYKRQIGTGHMIIVVCDNTGNRGFIDYQSNPPAFYNQFPENIATMTEVYLFFKT